MKMTRILAVATATLGGCMTLAGIITELITRADFGFFMITGGALAASAGAMTYARFIKRRWDEEDKE